MKPGFALSLSFEGISLLHNTADGWNEIGDVSPNSPDLGADLNMLRAAAEDLDPDNLFCQIIVPNDQIRYLTFESGAFGGDALRQMARTALDGATPYAVDDLVFDLSVDGDQTHVAAVARETLAEAEAFAVDHNFNPVGFAAIPPSGAFPGEPFFGATEFSKTLPDPRSAEPDAGIVMDVATQTIDNQDAGEPSQPDPTPILEPDTSQDDITPTEDVPNSADPVAPPVPVAGFSSRRRKPQNDPATAPPLAGASRDFDPQPATTSASQIVSEPSFTATEASVPSPVSVTAPYLDVPDLTEPDDPEIEPAAVEPASGFGGFLSRRKRPDAPAPVAATVPAPSPVNAIAELGPDDETARMTIFGARQSERVRGKPRFLGLMLTAALFLFLAAVAAWAALFLDKGLVSLLWSTPDETELASEPEPPAPDVLARGPNQLESPTFDVPDVGTAAPSSDALRSGPAPVGLPATTQPEAPGLTDTDSAVLEALRQPSVTEETDLPTELPVEPETAAQAEARYAATGIWPNAPQTPQAPAIINLDNLYIASIDRTDLSQDAVALPPALDVATDQPPNTVSSPAAAGTEFELDTDGLVAATAAGTLSPDGILVYLGRPPVVPPRTPTRFETEPELDVLRDRLAELRPRTRPDDLVERAERSQLGGLSRAELGTVRPKLRPRTVKQIAEEDETPTAQAVVVSRLPRPRPASFASIVRKPEATNNPSTARVEQVATVQPRTVSPSIPSTASVARQATLENAINLKRVNLIGVYGTPSNRRALVRLPSGRYKKVKVGDRVDGGRIVAIGDSELRYQKSGRNVTLKIPSG